MKCRVMVYALALFAVTASCAAQPQPVSAKKISEWVNKKEWANGLSLNLHATVDRDSFYVAYHRNKKLWDAAFAFLKNQQLEELKPGKYPIMGDAVFATITEAPSNKIEDVKWESHKIGRAHV